LVACGGTSSRYLLSFTIFTCVTTLRMHARKCRSLCRLSSCAFCSSADGRVGEYFTDITSQSQAQPNANKGKRGFLPSFEA
jgi:hypothetical protein